MILLKTLKNMKHFKILKKLKKIKRVVYLLLKLNFRLVDSVFKIIFFIRNIIKDFIAEISIMLVNILLNQLFFLVFRFILKTYILYIFFSLILMSSNYLTKSILH